MKTSTRVDRYRVRCREGKPPQPHFEPRTSTYKTFVDARACNRKMRYETKGQAKQGARTSRAQHGSILEPYRCPVCGLWHLTKRD